MQKKLREIPKIAIFIDSLQSGYHQHIWKFIQRETTDRKISMQCFCVGIFELQTEFLFERSRTFDLASFGRPDAAIVFANLIGTSIGETEAIKRIGNSLHVPLVSVGVECKGLPSVILDNSNGIMETIEHAVVDHGYMRYLVINGPVHNSDANERRYLIMKTLGQYDIDRKKNIHSIDWDYNAVQDCLAKSVRKIKRNKIEAILAFDDEVAIQISDTMDRDEFLVEAKPAIFGFNNIPEYIKVFPGLTTVNQPLDMLLKKSINICLDMINKKNVPIITKIPTRLVVRTSCGCRHWHNAHEGRSKKIIQMLEREISAIFYDIFLPGMPKEWLNISSQLFFRAVYKDIISGTQSDLAADVFRDLVAESGAGGVDVQLWEGFLDGIETILNPVFNSPIHEMRKDSLLNKLRDHLNSIAEYRTVSSEESRAVVFIERKYLSERLLTAHSYEELAEKLSRRLLQLSTPAFAFLLENNNSWKEDGDMLVAGDTNSPNSYTIHFAKRVSGIVFAEFAEKFAEKGPILIMALYHLDIFFGYIFFSAGNRDSSFYEAICSQISHVINSIRQHHQIKLHTDTLEGKVKERTTYLNRALNELETAYRQLKDIDEIKNDFILNITHDFRSPLTVINNLSELSLLDGDELDDDTRENFELIHTSGIQLKKYIDQLLDLSRIDAKGIKMSVSRILLNTFLERHAEFYRSSVSGSGITLRCKVPEQKIYIYTDAVKLEDILHNVVSNAVKFVNNDTGIIEISMISKDEKALISVKDNGAGIDKNNLELIFKKFEKFDRNARIKQRSTGIGLAYALQLTRIMNGRIWAESKGENRGAVFYIELPLGSEEYIKELQDSNKQEIEINREIEELLKFDIQQKENIKHNQKIVEIGERNTPDNHSAWKAVILIAEDDLNIRKIIHDFLRRGNYTNFLLASNGREAIELYEQYQPDLVISDLNMPVVRGDELYDILLDKPGGDHVPFIFLSAIGDQKISVKQKEKGALAYLKKPIDKNELLEIVNTQMKRYFGAQV